MGLFSLLWWNRQDDRRKTDYERGFRDGQIEAFQTVLGWAKHATNESLALKQRESPND